MLVCPVCALPLQEEEKCAHCGNGHTFDRARQGYLNLLNAASSKGHGDDASMLLKRREFLEAGHYDLLSQRVAETAAEVFPEKGVLLDAGCGEGYYTQKTALLLEEQGKNPEIYAFDIAKEASKMTAVRMGKKGHFFVASTFHIPMLASCVDLVMSLFAPYSEEEFLRVLKPGGYLLRAVPLEEHLFQLKRAVYENPKKNESAAVIGEGFSVVRETRIRGEITLTDQAQIRALFGMTPYAHKTGKEDREKLDRLKMLTTELDFGLILYQKRD